MTKEGLLQALKSRVLPQLDDDEQDVFDEDKWEIELHIFTNNLDEWLPIERIDEAVQLFKEWGRENGTARIYFNYCLKEDNYTEEIGVMHHGEFPW